MADTKILKLQNKLIISISLSALLFIASLFYFNFAQAAESCATPPATQQYTEGMQNPSVPQSRQCEVNASPGRHATSFSASYSVDYDIETFDAGVGADMVACASDADGSFGLCDDAPSSPFAAFAEAGDPLSGGFSDGFSLDAPGGSNWKVGSVDINVWATQTTSFMQGHAEISLDTEPDIIVDPPQCNDEDDNDEDGFTDFPDDPGCADANDNDEFNPGPDPVSPPDCQPNNQSIAPNTNVYLNVAAGMASYSWSAPGGTPSIGSNPNFVTQFSEVGNHPVTITTDTGSDTCNVLVTDGGNDPPPVSNETEVYARGFAYEDYNQNAVMDPGEPGIPDVTVQINGWIGSRGVSRYNIYNMKTGADGYYAIGYPDRNEIPSLDEDFDGNTANPFFVEEDEDTHECCWDLAVELDTLPAPAADWTWTGTYRLDAPTNTWEIVFDDWEGNTPTVIDWVFYPNTNVHPDFNGRKNFGFYREHVLTVTKSGTGTGTVTSNPPGINCGVECSHGFAGQVTLTAQPAAGSSFSGWSGDCNAAGQVTMTANRTCNAEFSLLAPTTDITSVVGANCPSQHTVNWNDVATETRYNVWWNTNNTPFNYGAGDGWTSSANLAANTTSYINPQPPLVTNSSYWYIVTATNASGSNASAPSGPHLALGCTANLTATNKTIVSVNGQAYNNSTVIKTGDTVVFRITLSNAGPSNATINYICDTPSSNFALAGTFVVAGGGAGNTITTPAANCGGASRINVSGNLASGSSWTVTFNSAFNSSGAGSVELCENRATVNFNDTEANGKTLSTRFGPTLCSKNLDGIPDFHEIAP